MSNPVPTPRQSILEYAHAPPDEAAQQPQQRPRPKWVYIVVAIYALILFALLIAPALVAVADSNLQELALTGGYVVSLVLCGLGMLLVPVRARQRRPVGRRSVWIMVIASGFLFALLAGGAALAMGEYARHEWTPLVLLGGTATVWAGWALLFGLLGRFAHPLSFAGKLHKLVLSGSVLELLIAVPLHVVVRRRSDCCAGLETGIGISVGLTVMIIAFGPAVLLLYWKRWKRITGR